MLSFVDLPMMWLGAAARFVLAALLGTVLAVLGIVTFSSSLFFASGFALGYITYELGRGFIRSRS